MQTQEKRGKDGHDAGKKAFHSDAKIARTGYPSEIRKIIIGQSFSCDFMIITRFAKNHASIENKRTVPKHVFKDGSL